MEAIVIDWKLEQGANLKKVFRWRDEDKKPMNLVGFTAHCQLRPTASSDTVLLDLTTENGGIELGSTDGLITLLADASTTASLGSCVYDVLMKSADGFITKVLKGKVIVSPTVTKT